ncbi:MAG: SDR family NAD(P)-dependent oxidoreductase, partial [Chloroflexales bacterium]|nr:SDR family NAD(P)-dependent oxidoreductase [Chloroflexales bacterium]
GEVRHLGGRAVAIAADLSLQDERLAAFAQARQALGPIDLLVNNAGELAGGTLGRLDDAEIARSVALNLAAPMHLTQLALPDLTARRGAVVLVASMAGIVPLPYASVYSGSKAGLVGFGRALRYELEPLGVRLLIANPPATDTAMTDGMIAAAGLPVELARLQSPEQIGEDIVAALVRGRHELIWPGADHLLALAWRLAPWLVAAGLRSQRGRFARAMGRGGRS